MNQDRSTGAAADRWGRETARVLARAIGATTPSIGSNECLLEGNRIVIKCAAVATDSVGVTFKMLDRLDAVVGAFQLEDGVFDVWSLTPSAFRAGMRDTRSRGASAGKVGLVCKDVFVREGRSLGRVRL
jgi:hypothetical protein